MKLYDYQERAVKYAVDMLFKRGNSLIVAGTGAGKTIMLAAAIGQFFNGFIAQNNRPPHILILVHRTEIHGQNHNKFSMVCPQIQTSEITALRKSVKGYAHFGMVQTVGNVFPEFVRENIFFDLIVIDEAHHSKAATYENIIELNRIGKPNAALLGVTATPNRGDKLPLAHLFDNFYQITTKFLIDSHYLVRPTFVDLTPIFETKKGMEKGHLAKNIEFDETGIELIDHLCRDYLKHKEDGKTIIFAPSHKFCELIYETLVSMGRNPAYLRKNISDDERKAELERFESGEADELINVDIATEGYDFPALRNIVDFDTNGTQSQWIQKVGRVLRTFSSKTSCTVIDFGGNVAMYGENGIETDVCLDGEFAKEQGERLNDDDFFKNDDEPAEKSTAAYELVKSSEYTPYNPPAGFETINDKDFGIVFVACGATNDCIIFPCGEEYKIVVTDKGDIIYTSTGNFLQCVVFAFRYGIYHEHEKEKPISNLQIKMLAPEYPTNTLTYYGANCTICWKCWKNTVGEIIKANNK